MTTPLLLTLGLILSVSLVCRAQTRRVPMPPFHWFRLHAVQTGLGTGLIVRALYRRRPVVLLVVATVLTASLVWLRVTRWM